MDASPTTGAPTPAIMASATATFFLGGGLSALALALGNDDAFPVHERVILALGCVALLLGGVVLRWGRLLPRVAFHPVVAAASVLICAGVLACQNPTTAILVTGLHLFVLIDIVFFFTLRAALAQTSLVLAAAWVGLAPHGLPWGMLLTVGLLAAAIALVVGRLVRLAAHSTRDPLTGLANRRGFLEALQEEVHRARRGGGSVSLMMVDLDHFKAVNDTGGHAVGDELLRQVAVELELLLPGRALVARLGGDEFALLVRDVGPVALGALVDGRRRAIPTGVSVGIAQWHDGESPTDLLRHADLALYAAKDAGRGTTRTMPAAA